MRCLPVGIGIEDGVRCTVEAFVGSILPELRSICIRVGDARQCQAPDSQEELDSQKGRHDLRPPPLPRKPDPRHGVCTQRSRTLLANVRTFVVPLEVRWLQSVAYGALRVLWVKPALLSLSSSSSLDQGAVGLTYIEAFWLEEEVEGEKSTGDEVQALPMCR